MHLVRFDCRASDKGDAINTTWLANICANTILYALLWRYRPSGSRWLWISQTVVIVATVVNLVGWYALSDDVYNRNWNAMHLLQLWTETALLVSLLRQTEFLTESTNAEAGAAMTLLLKLYVALQSFWAWDSTLFAEGLQLLHVSHWLNVLTVALLCAVTYSRRRRIHVKKYLVELDEEKDANLIFTLKSKGAVVADDTPTDGSDPKKGGGHGN